MSRFIPVETPGGMIWAEVAEAADIKSLTLTSVEERVFTSFEEAVNALKKNAQFLIEAMEELAPREVEVSFGLKVGAEAGLPIFGLAKASGEASYEVKITWSSEAAKKKPRPAAPQRPER